MKKIYLSIALLSACASLRAQQYMRVWQGEESQRIALSDAAQMPVSGGEIKIGGRDYALSSIDSITIVKTIGIEWNGSSVNVNIPDAAKKDLAVKVEGGHVTITNNNVSEEMEFVLTGESANGSLTYNGSYKCKFHLNGVSLTSGTGAALDIQCGKRVDLILADGTQNVLEDGKTGSQKAALYCKGHLEMQGAGSLSVKGNCKHAVSTKEYLLLKKNLGTLSIKGAASDALHVGQYFQMNGGTLAIDENTMADGIQVDATNDTTDELNGQIIIKGGAINATIAHEDCKGIKNEGSEDNKVKCGDITISGGNININANGNGSRGIQTNANMKIEGDAIIRIVANGGNCTQTSDPHQCMGIKVDGNLTVTGGTTTVLQKNEDSLGIKVKKTYTKTGGTVKAVVTED